MEGPVGMIHYQKVGITSKIVILPLLLRYEKRENMVVQNHPAGIEYQLVELEYAVAMLVDINLERAVTGMNSQLIMVGESKDVVPKLLVIIVYHIGILGAFIQYIVYACVGVKVGAQPAG